MTQDRRLLVADFAQATQGDMVRLGAVSDRFTGEEHRCVAGSVLPMARGRQAVRLVVFFCITEHGER